MSIDAYMCMSIVREGTGRGVVLVFYEGKEVMLVIVWCERVGIL